MSRFRTVAVMGTGTMGPGMGAVLARAGHGGAPVRHERRGSSRRRRRCYDIAWGVLDRLETPDKGGGSVRYASDVAEALDGRRAVIEAVPEKLDLKKQVFAEYEQHVGPEVLLASNTSGIPITKIAEDLAASRARRGHALVEPAAPHPDDRGHARARRPRQTTSRPRSR